MRDTRTSLLRRAVMWAAGVVLVMSVAALPVSRLGVSWCGADRQWWAALREGQVWVGHPASGGPGASVPHGWSTRWQPALWVPAAGARRGWWHRVHLWTPLVAGGAVLLAGWATGLRALKVAPSGFCSVCHYDLSGITGPCPECGKANA